MFARVGNNNAIRASRYNTCTHVNEHGIIDCDEKADEYSIFLYCRKHAIELHFPIPSGDVELDNRTHWWREFFNGRA